MKYKETRDTMIQSFSLTLLDEITQIKRVRQSKVPWIIYPDDSFKQIWDMIFMM